MTTICAVKPAGKHWIFGILPLTAVLQHHPAAFTSVCLVKQQHHILICPILPLQISRQRSKISLLFPTDQLLCWRVIGLTITGTEKSVTPPSVGIHEIYPSWYLCRCRNSLWTLKLQVCECVCAFFQISPVCTAWRWNSGKRCICWRWGESRQQSGEMKMTWLWPQQKQEGTRVRDGEMWPSVCLLPHWRLNTPASLWVSQTHPTILAYLLYTRWQKLSW